MSIQFDEKFQVYRRREMIRLPNGESVRLSATGETKAALKVEFERKRAEAIEAARRGPVAPPKGGKSFETFAAEWLRTYPAAAKNRATTVAEKTYHVTVRLLPYFRRLSEERGRAITLGEITPKVIDKLIADLAESTKLSADRRDRLKPLRPTEKKLSAQTVRNIMQTFRKMLVSAKRWDEIETLPEVPSVKTPKPKIDFLKFDEADRLLGAIDEPEDLALFTTALKTGLRAGELLGLQWSSVDTTKRELRIETQLAHKGIKLVPVKAGARTVPMSGALTSRLKVHRHLRGPWVFCSADGNPFSRYDLIRKLEKWLKRAGVRRVHPHLLRHSFASHLVMRGVPIVQIQHWLGHTSITMTMRYAHLAPGSGAQMVNVLDGPAPVAREAS